MKLDHLTLEDVLKKSALPHYKDLQRALWESLVRLHTNLTIIRQINAIPWEQDSSSIRGFFGYLNVNLLEYSVIIFHRIWLDTDSNAITLKRLRRAMHDGCYVRWRPHVKERLKSLRALEPDKTITARIEQVRNKYLAHLDEPFRLGQIQSLGRVSIEDFEEQVHCLGSIYDGLNIGRSSSFVLVNYSWTAPSEGPLGYVQQLIAAHSNNSSSFDEHPDYWHRHVFPKLSAEDISRLNRARGTANLPPLPTHAS